MWLKPLRLPRAQKKQHKRFLAPTLLSRHPFGTFYKSAPRCGTAPRNPPKL